MTEVLIVDDEAVFSGLICAQLTTRGFSVAVGSSGAEALERIRARPPAAILLDIMIPDINGIDILRRLKSDPKTASIPVIMCSTAAQDRRTIDSMLRLGALAFISKPCQPDDLARRIKAAVASES